MAAVNSIITKADYNNIRNKLIAVMGTGSSNYGWGQDTRILSSAVTESNRISINDWGKLRYDIINAYTHIFGTTPTVAQVDEGYTIKYSNTFVPDTGPSPSTPSRTDAPVTQYDTWVNQIVANRFTVASGQYSTTAAVSASKLFNSSTSPTVWRNQIQCNVTVEFDTANQARYFFNSGGLVRITSSRTTGSGSLGTAQATSWTTLLSSAGTRSFGANTPGTGTSPLDGLNWYRTSTTPSQWFSLSSSSPYGSNQYRIFASTNVADNSSGTATVGTFGVNFLDNYTDPGSPPPYDDVDGEFIVSASLVYATGIMAPLGTGNFSVTLPRVTVGPFTVYS